MYRNIKILDEDMSRIWLIIGSILRESWAHFCEEQKNTFEQEKSDVRREICRQKGFQSFCRFQESSIFCIHKWIEESPTSSQEMEKCLPFIFVLNQDILKIKKNLFLLHLLIGERHLSRSFWDVKSNIDNETRDPNHLIFPSTRGGFSADGAGGSGLPAEGTAPSAGR